MWPEGKWRSTGNLFDNQTHSYLSSFRYQRLLFSLNGSNDYMTVSDGYTWWRPDQTVCMQVRVSASNFTRFSIVCGTTHRYYPVSERSSSTATSRIPPLLRAQSHKNLGELLLLFAKCIKFTVTGRLVNLMYQQNILFYISYFCCYNFFTIL